MSEQPEADPNKVVVDQDLIHERFHQSEKSRAAFAEHLGVGIKTLRQMERGEEISKDLARTVANKLNVSYARLTRKNKQTGKHPDELRTDDHADQPHKRRIIVSARFSIPDENATHENALKMIASMVANLQDGFALEDVRVTIGSLCLTFRITEEDKDILAGAFIECQFDAMGIDTMWLYEGGPTFNGLEYEILHLCCAKKPPEISAALHLDPERFHEFWIRYFGRFHISVTYTRTQNILEWVTLRANESQPTDEAEIEAELREMVLA